MSSIFDPRALLQSSIQDYLPQLNSGGTGIMGGLTAAQPVDQIANFAQNLPTGGTDYLAAQGGAGQGGFLNGLFDNFLSTKDANGITTQGWGGPALGAASGLLQGFMGMKQYGLAKEGLEESKRQFGLNYDAQKKTTNAALEDRQRARVASNSGAYESVGSYLDRNGIK